MSALGTVLDPRRAVLQDMHVHSRFSDGANTIAENVAEAESLGLFALTCVDHVRHDTDWIPEYAAAVREAAGRTRVELRCGVEAKLLDTSGALDLPRTGLDGVDWIFAADHQVPLADGPTHPREVRERIERGELDAATVVQAIADATAGAVRRFPGRVVIAHLFSILPKIGLSETDVPADAIDAMARASAEAGGRVEVSERWRCPSAQTLRRFAAHGVPILLSTDSHRRETIGRYEYAAGVAGELAAGG